MKIEDIDSIKELQNKQTKKKKKKKFNFWKLILYVFLVIFVMILICAGIGFYIVKKIIDDTPPITNFDYKQLLAQNSVILDSNGELLEKIQNGDMRTVIPYEKIDKDIIDAFVAVEDKTFFTHKGFNYTRLIGSVVEAVLEKKSPSGTSTITQQYARNMYLTDTRFAKGQKGYVRKIKEAYYTVLIEKYMSKEDILSAYLNTIELGANVKGIEAACQRYFSKSAEDVDYIEAAILAGIPKANTTYSPFSVRKKEDVLNDDIKLGDYDDQYVIVFNKNCLKRYNVVLSVMKNLDIIDDDQYTYAKTFDISTKLHPGQFRRDDISSYFADMVKDEVVRKLILLNHLEKQDALNLLNNGGLKIYSTLDTKLQKILENNYNTNELTNVFDEDTRIATIHFQKKYKLQPSGIVNYSTIEKLKELNLIEDGILSKESYSKGMNDDDIVLIKKAFEKNGDYYKQNKDLPPVRAYRDIYKNILNIVDKQGTLKNYGVLLYKYENLIDVNKNLVIPKNDFELLQNSELKIKKNSVLNFYNIGNRVDVFVKDTYKTNDNFVKRLVGRTNLYNEIVSIKEYYVIKGNSVNIDDKFKRLDENGNLIISRAFFDENPDFYKISENGNLLVSDKYYSISSIPIIQPQSAMVVTDYKNGELKAIIGGRNVSGQRIYNRAINPRPPGSSIKPIAVYLPALDNGYTAATAIDDVPMKKNGKLWPKNWYYSYKGIRSLRQAVEYSINTIPVKVINDIGVDKSVSYLKKFGISTLVETGAVNDLNPAALALGGMTKGITPFDMTGAYGAIANGGIRNETITFTKIEDRDGNVILENIPQKTFIVDSKQAYLMLDILRTTVTNGIAGLANMNNKIAVAGKTGTTSSNNDIWFAGLTPYYSATIWIGNDYQIPLIATSDIATKFWAKIMREIHKDLEPKNFITPAEAGLIAAKIDRASGKLPSRLSARDPVGSVYSEWFVPGTVPNKIDDGHIELDICVDDNKIATKYTPENKIGKKVYRLRLDPDMDPYSYGSITIQDENYTLPKKFIKNGKIDELLDISVFNKRAKNPFSTAFNQDNYKMYDVTNILKNVNIVDLGDGNKLIADNITVVTVNNTSIDIPYGSRINDNGIITTAQGMNISIYDIANYQLENGQIISVKAVNETIKNDDKPMGVEEAIKQEMQTNPENENLDKTFENSTVIETKENENVNIDEIPDGY